MIALIFSIYSHLFWLEIITGIPCTPCLAISGVNLLLEHPLFANALRGRIETHLRYARLLNSINDNLKDYLKKIIIFVTLVADTCCGFTY